MKRPRDIWYAAGRDKNKSPGIVNHRNCLHGNRQTMTMCQRHVTRRWTRKHDKNTLPPYFGGEVIFFAADCTAGVSRERAGNLQYFSMEGEQGAGCARWMKKRDFLSREGYGRLVYSFFFFFTPLYFEKILDLPRNKLFRGNLWIERKFQKSTILDRIIFVENWSKLTLVIFENAIFKRKYIHRIKLTLYINFNTIKNSICYYPRVTIYLYKIITLYFAWYLYCFNIALNIFLSTSTNKLFKIYIINLVTLYRLLIKLIIGRKIYNKYSFALFPLKFLNFRKKEKKITRHNRQKVS